MIINQKFKLVIFDMDGTLLNGRSIVVISEKKAFKNELLTVLQKNIEPYQKSIEIAKFLKGYDSEDMLNIYRKIPLQNNVEYITKKLKEKAVKTAIATDSYQFIADDLKKRLQIDYAFANILKIKNRIITGELIIHNQEKKICHLDNIYSICKSMILDRLCNKLNIKTKEVIAVGDGVVDIGMISKAGLGIAYNAPGQLKKYADIATNDLSLILDYI
jgi:phosphoserine phosphatase